jgi:hypothetical protein
LNGPRDYGHRGGDGYDGGSDRGGDDDDDGPDF